MSFQIFTHLTNSHGYLPASFYGIQPMQLKLIIKYPRINKSSIRITVSYGQLAPRLLECAASAREAI
jgi:hypothetical protein